jgi:hypothetical protein
MGRRPSEKYTIERIDNDAGYAPENCRWATRSEQARNRSSTRRLTINGETKSVAAWAEQQGINPQTVTTRLYRGDSPERAVFAPVDRRSYNARAKQPRSLQVVITEETYCPLTGCRADASASRQMAERGPERPVTLTPAPDATGATPAAPKRAAVRLSKPRGSKRTAPTSYHAEASGHVLDAVKGPGGWVIDCPAFPELAAAHDGCDDLCACLDEFEVLAQANSAKKRGAA